MIQINGSEKDRGYNLPVATVHFLNKPKNHERGLMPLTLQTYKNQFFIADSIDRRVTQLVVDVIDEHFDSTVDVIYISSQTGYQLGGGFDYPGNILIQPKNPIISDWKCAQLEYEGSDDWIDVTHLDNCNDDGCICYATATVIHNSDESICEYLDTTIELITSGDRFYYAEINKWRNPIILRDNSIYREHLTECYFSSYMDCHLFQRNRELLSIRQELVNVAGAKLTKAHSELLRAILERKYLLNPVYGDYTSNANGKIISLHGDTGINALSEESREQFAQEVQRLQKLAGEYSAQGFRELYNKLKERQDIYNAVVDGYLTTRTEVDDAFKVRVVNIKETKW